MDIRVYYEEHIDEQYLLDVEVAVSLILQERLKNNPREIEESLFPYITAGIKKLLTVLFKVGKNEEYKEQDKKLVDKIKNLFIDIKKQDEFRKVVGDALLSEPIEEILKRDLIGEDFVKYFRI